MISEALNLVLVYSAGAHRQSYLKYRYEFLLMSQINWASALVSVCPLQGQYYSWPTFT